MCELAQRNRRARSLSAPPSHPSRTPQHTDNTAASPAVRAALADPAAITAAARVLTAPAAATERVLDAEVSAAGSLGPLAAAVLETLAPDEAGLVVVGSSARARPPPPV